MNIQERIEALETEFAEKIKALKAEAQQRDEFPQFGDDYWFINSTGKVVNEKWGGLSYEIDRLKIENIFRTEEQAEFAAEKLKVEAELRKFSRPFEYGENNHIICVEKNINRLFTIGRLVDHYQGAIYFESKGKAEEAIRSVGAERIEKYIFGVEE